MKKIFKYQIELTPEQPIQLPKGAKILTAQIQEIPGVAHDQICLWALVDPEAPMANGVVWIFGTGHQAPNVIDEMTYAGTVQQYGGRLVWHIFASGEWDD